MPGQVENCNTPAYIDVYMCVDALPGPSAHTITLMVAPPWGATHQVARAHTPVATFWTTCLT